MKLNTFKVVSPDFPGMEWRFTAVNAMDAMKKMLYTLNWGKLDGRATIKPSPNGVVMEHAGKAYWCRA